MEGTHYSWRDQDSQLFFGEPSRRIFDRSNGTQVLFIINFYASLCEQFSPGEGKKIEQQIADSLPADIKSEISVFNWLRKQTL